MVQERNYLYTHTYMNTHGVAGQRKQMWQNMSSWWIWVSDIRKFFALSLKLFPSKKCKEKKKFSQYVRYKILSHGCFNWLLPSSLTGWWRVHEHVAGLTSNPWSSASRGSESPGSHTVGSESFLPPFSKTAILYLLFPTWNAMLSAGAVYLTLCIFIFSRENRSN